MVSLHVDSPQWGFDPILLRPLGFPCAIQNDCGLCSKEVTFLDVSLCFFFCAIPQFSFRNSTNLWSSVRVLRAVLFLVSVVISKPKHKQDSYGPGLTFPKQFLNLKSSLLF